MIVSVENQKKKKNSAVDHLLKLAKSNDWVLFIIRCHLSQLSRHWTGQLALLEF